MQGAGILDDLLGTSSASKHLQRPGTSEKREFVLDKKYMKGGSGLHEIMFAFICVCIDTNVIYQSVLEK